MVPGGLPAFKSLENADKMYWREQAICNISEQCVKENKVGIVTGHFMFWDQDDSIPDRVLTTEDWKAFTHVLYLDIPVERLVAQINGDRHRTDRAVPSKTHLEKWQKSEKRELESGCLQNDIAFQTLTAGPEEVLDKTLEYLNGILADVKLDSIINSRPLTPRTALLLDGDKTLIPDDTGEMFWRIHDGRYPLKQIFDKGYSYRTFQEATNLYPTREKSFEDTRGRVAGEVHVYSEFVQILKEARAHQHVVAIVITCGLANMWEQVLSAKGIRDMVYLVGSEQDGIIVTPELKGALVDRLHNVHKQFVLAIGDSPVDLPMLRKADQAIVVVDEEDARSRSMEAKLEVEIQKGLDARQALMQVGSKSHLLDFEKLPLVNLQDAAFMQTVTATPKQLQYIHATEKNAAKLLMSATRNADVKGPALVDAHRAMGRYLATEYLGDVLGLEEYSMKHVQGGETNGCRLFAEHNTVIVPLMRGGEPMARGVWEAFPNAMYVHAKHPSDLQKDDHIVRRAAIVLVDGVANTGNTLVDFVKHIRKCDSRVKIVVIAGVVQEQAVEEGGVLSRLSNRYGGLSLIALRTSENKYKGKGATDTGHRLFNTTHMD